MNFFFPEEATTSAPVVNPGNIVGLAFADQARFRERCPNTWRTQLAVQCPASAVMLVQGRHGLDVGGMLSRCAPAGCVHVREESHSDSHSGGEADEMRMLLKAVEVEAKHLVRVGQHATFDGHLEHMRSHFRKDGKRIRWALGAIMQEADDTQRDYAALNFLLQEASFKGVVGKDVEAAANALERHLARERSLTIIRRAPGVMVEVAKRVVSLAQGRVERAAETFASRVVEANREASAKTQAGLLAAAQGKNVAYTKEVAEMDEKIEAERQETAAAERRTSAAAHEVDQRATDILKLRAEADKARVEGTQAQMLLEMTALRLEQELGECKNELANTVDRAAQEGVTRMALDHTTDWCERQVAQLKEEASTLKAIATERWHELDAYKLAAKELEHWIAISMVKTGKLDSALNKARKDRREYLATPWGIACARHPPDEPLTPN